MAEQSKFVGDIDEAKSIAAYLQKQKTPTKKPGVTIEMSQPSPADLTFYQRIKRALGGQ